MLFGNIAIIFNLFTLKEENVAKVVKTLLPILKKSEELNFAKIKNQNVAET